jgi:hypothetical protein
MKRLFFVAVMTLTLSSCVIEDNPSVEFEATSYTISKEGGELIIPTTTTGIDQVRITYRGNENWDIDPETGDMTPVDGWCKLVKVIQDYPTRALAQWRSGIVLQIEPNTTEYTRDVFISVQSFTISKMITVTQEK